MQQRLFSLLSQPPVKYVNRVLGEQINCVCLGWRALQREGLLPLTASRAAGCTESPCPFVKAGAKRRTGFEKYSRAGINSLHEPRAGPLCYNTSIPVRLRGLDTSAGDGNQTTLPMGNSLGMEMKLSQEETSVLSPYPGLQREHFILVCVPLSVRLSGRVYGG